jgi:TonB family protein
MLELSQKRTAGAAQGNTPVESRQSRKLLIAFVLLVVALVAVLFSDRQFWFGADHSTIESDIPEPPALPAATRVATAQKLAVQSNKKRVAGVGSSSKLSAEKTAAAAAEDPQSSSPAVTANRVVLAPLDVEVVAGDAHHKIRPGVNSTKVEITDDGSSRPAVNAAEHEPLSAAALRTPQSSYSATYPLLAQHMNVQGSVVLQAVIGADGVVENLRVLSGPGILASAAQQAVREWKFKPVLQNGQAVETQATITVNFTIKVMDNAPRSSLAGF